MTTTFPTYQPPRKNHTKLGLVVVTGLVILAMIALSALAIAVHSSLQSPTHSHQATTQVDPTEDIPDFLQSMDAYGITGINGDDSLVTQGRNVCTNLSHGNTHLQEVNAILAANPGMDREEAMKVVTFANIFLCVDVDMYDTTIPPLAQQ
jgi:hypothetical protein